MKRACILACLPLLLAGCAAVATATDPPAAMSSSPAQNAQTLTQNHWFLQTATDSSGQPIAALEPSKNSRLRLVFQNHHLSVSGGCNSMGGDYQLHDGTLTVHGIISTMMACMDGAKNRLDKAAKALLRQPLAFTITHTGGQPTLTLVAPNGDTLVFRGAPATTR